MSNNAIHSIMPEGKKLASQNALDRLCQRERGLPNNDVLGAQNGVKCEVIDIFNKRR